MGVMINRNACSWKSILVLAAVVLLAGFRPGLAEDQEIKKLRQAAEQGDASAQFTLGRMYVKGEGVLEDYVQAYAWFILAATQGEEQAFQLKEDLRPMMSTEQIAEAQKLSAKLWERIESSKPQQPPALPIRPCRG